ncbi:hypothetical protein CYMTET_20919 [Cymbomonas tetramitiformis]|uniref:Uncharacterized protein n=1 Tax=Cymbomonas tetramitiformis TaxID=36881 RepID=A0AAE0G3L4_9CHLO|nr:hypothetical protein CYMTET_20919 [Cymbomonas tetramitiformis]
MTSICQLASQYFVGYPGYMEVVRNTPTLATPEVEEPGAAKAADTANVIIIARRRYLSDQTDIVKRVRESGLHRKGAKNLRETVLGGKHEKFAGKDKDVAKLGHSSSERARVYDTFSEVVDPRPVLANEHRLVRENRAVDWQPTEATRRQQLFDRLDPDFYRAVVRDRYPLPADLLAVTFTMLAQLVTTIYTNWADAPHGEVVGTAAAIAAIGTAAAIPTGDNSEAKQLLKIVVDELRVLEHFIKNQKCGGLRPGCAASGAALLQVRQGWQARGYNAYKNCPLGGDRPGAHAFCCPTAENDEDEMRALALCHVYQQAAGDGGPEAFSQVCDVHIFSFCFSPEVGAAGGSTVGVDLSRHGFAVGSAQAKEQDDSAHVNHFGEPLSRKWCAKVESHFRE